MTTTDRELLRTFASKSDSASFAEIVHRHIGFVYAVCCRRLRDPHSAQDATQAVFIAMARKARKVADSPNLLGWLHRSACYETNNLMRSQSHRLARESEAYRLGTVTPGTHPHLEGLEQVLDDALNELPGPDRAAVFSRFFAGQSYAAIGLDLGVSENAARMRVDRALKKLRARLSVHGCTSSAAALAAALPSLATVPTPAAMTQIVVQASLAGAAATSTALTAVTLMSTPKALVGLTAAIAVTSCALWIQARRTNSELRQELAIARDAAKASERMPTQLTRPLPEPSTLGNFGSIKSDKPLSESGAAEHQRQSAGGGFMTWKPSGQTDARLAADAHNATSLRDTYEPFLKNIGLTGPEIERFFELQMVSLVSRRELFKRAVEQAPDRDPATIKMVAQAVAQEARQALETSLAQDFGLNFVETLRKYQQELPAQSIVQKVDQAVRRADTTLTTEQKDRLRAAIKSHSFDDHGEYNLQANADVILHEAARYLSNEQLLALRDSLLGYRPND